MNLAPVTLAGRHVRLEPLSLDHLDALLEVAGDAAVWRYMSGDCSKAEGMREFIESASSGQHAGNALPFVTIEGGSGRPIGSTRFGNIVPEHKRVEIGWTWIAPAWQRTAINTEAKYLMMRYAFEQLGCNRVELKTHAQNVKSRTAILRVGAKEEGTLRSHMVMPDGSLRDTVYFSVIAPEWPDVKRGLEQKLLAQ
jgi:RimJ/RimL family protein N-acetyltransferase